MQQPRNSTRRLMGGCMLAIGLGWVLWVVILGFALRDGLAETAGSVSTVAVLQAFLRGAWHLLLPGVLLALFGSVLLWRAWRRA